MVLMRSLARWTPLLQMPTGGMMFRRRGGWWRMAAVALLLALGACAAPQEGRKQEETPKTTVQVENRNWLDMTIYVLRGAQRHRLGIVRAASTKVLKIPDYLVVGPTTLQFLADPIGSATTPISQRITVTPGDQVELYIPN